MIFVDSNCWALLIIWCVLTSGEYINPWSKRCLQTQMQQLNDCSYLDSITQGEPHPLASLYLIDVTFRLCCVGQFNQQHVMSVCAWPQDGHTSIWRWCQWWEEGNIWWKMCPLYLSITRCTYQWNAGESHEPSIQRCQFQWFLVRFTIIQKNNTLIGTNIMAERWTAKALYKH